MPQQEETELAKARLHWGIFIPVLICAGAVILLAALMAFALHGLFGGIDHAMRVNQSAGIPGVRLLWSFPLLFGFVAVLPLLLGTWIAYKKSEARLTDQRLVFRSGFLARRFGEVPLENVESIYLSEPLLGRMCNFGSITLTTVGGASFRLAFVGSPQNFHSILQEAVLNAKNRGRQTIKPPETLPQVRDDDSRYMPKG